VIHYWWSGPEDGGEVDIRDCSFGLVIAKYEATAPARYIFDDALPLDISFKTEHWHCALFMDEGVLKHYLVPPGFIPPPSYMKVRDEACDWDYYVSRPNNSGLI
jgi:hypothetical protein